MSADGRIRSWDELDAYLRQRTEDFSADYLDDETAQNLPPDARQRSLGRVAMLTELRVMIAPQGFQAPTMGTNEAAERRLRIILRELGLQDSGGLYAFRNDAIPAIAARLRRDGVVVAPDV